MPERTVRLIQERTFDPPRDVEVERDGRWHPAAQRSWQLWEDERGWVAEVEYTVTYYWGLRTQVAVVPADRLRLQNLRNSDGAATTEGAGPLGAEEHRAGPLTTRVPEHRGVGRVIGRGRDFSPSLETVK